MGKYLILVLVSLILCGCDSNLERQKDLDRTIMISDSGVKYIVEHYIGDTYTLTPLKEKAN